MFGKKNKEKDEIRQIFGKYISDDKIDEILSQESTASKTHDVRLTLLMINIVDYVGLCERNESSEVMTFLNERYFAEVYATLDKSGCQFDRTVGDRITVFWEDGSAGSDSTNVCTLALEILKKNQTLNHRYPIAKQFDITCAVSSGNAVRVQLSYVGEAVNRLSFLTEEAKKAESKFLIDKETMLGLGPSLAARTFEGDTPVRSRIGPTFEVIAN